MVSSEDVSKGGKPVADETTPLLVASEAGPTAPSNEQAPQHENNPRNEEDDKPLPKLQIALLCYARLVEPIAFFSIFPFVNQMLEETGDLDEADVGFYSGLIESLFSLTQMLLMIPWGRAADKYGRKPVLVGSLVGVTIATSLFGLSTKIWQMILFRCLAGVFAGTIVTIRSMLSEHSTPRTQARAFSWFAFTNNLGIFLGPLIGGVFANVADQYPRIFGNIQFFKDYPYALPGFIGGFIGLTSVITSALFLTETLTPDRRASNKASPHAMMSTWEIMKYPGVANVIVIYGYTMLLGLAYTAIAPLAWFTSVDLGGFGFSPIRISLFLGLAGISQATWILIAYPPLQHRLGTGGVMRICAYIWPIFFACVPFLNILLKHHHDAVFYTLMSISTIICSGVSMNFTGVQLALNDIAPSPTTLGTLNALALALVSGIRAVAPALFSSLCATGFKKQIFAGYFIWVILVALTLGYIVTIQWLPSKAEGKLNKPADED